MTTFAFIVLTFVLYTVAGFFVYCYAKQELKATLKSHIRKERDKNQIVRVSITQIQARQDEVESTMDRVLALPNNKGLVSVPTGNFRENMENRAIQQNQKVVAVDGVQKMING